MKRDFLAPLLLLLLLPSPAPAAGPVFDPFVERFAVGEFADPDAMVWREGWPADLWQPARPDSVWLAKSLRLSAGFGGGPRFRSLAAGLPSGAGVTAPAGDAALLTGDLAATRTAMAALARGDTLAARNLALDLAGNRRASGAARVVWSLRAASITPQGPVCWPEVEELIPELGPWDAANAWAMATALRRKREQPAIPLGSDDAHGRMLARLSRTRLSSRDLATSPYSDALKGALGAVSLNGEELRRHMARYGTPPTSASLQGLWIRGQRSAAAGDPARYEELARRDDLAGRWRMDLWRRASERRLLSGQWPAGVEDLELALATAREHDVEGGLRSRLHVWAEQALVLALARVRLEDADRILVLIREHLAAAPDDALAERAQAWAGRLAGNEDPVATGADRVDRARILVRSGNGPEATRATTDERRLLVRGTADLWDLWLRWGLALTSQPGIPAERRAAAESYHRDLSLARDADARGRGCLPAAMGRLASHGGTLEALLVYANDQDVRELVRPESAPLSSPLPELVTKHAGSQADLHALLGVALFLEDMRGLLAAATPLAGTGLTRDEKRRFLYPLPGPGDLLDALLGADNDPALILAIARNESLFEPAARSRAGALGWLQIMPFHYPDLGARPGSEHWSNAPGAVARGDGLITENRRRYRGDPYRLLAAYNAGPGAAGRWDEQLGGAADRAEYLAWIGYTETRAYVEKVLIDKIIYDWILDGAPGASATPSSKE